MTSSTKHGGGRRPGDSGTREAILDAAREQFGQRGYDGATFRSIAGEAGVDPALIRHFFGDKASLFVTSVIEGSALPDRLLAALPGDRDGLGRRVVDTYFRLWEDPQTRPTLEALLRSAVTSPAAGEMLAGLMLGRMRDGAGPAGPGAEGLGLAGASLLGVAFGRYVLRIAPLAAMSHDELVDHVAPTVQRYLAG